MDKNLIMNPKISIILPVYNGARFIKRAISSALDQSFADFELIVVDDCSKDETRNIVFDISKNDDRVKYFLNKKNLKIAQSLNVGLKLAKGEYIARLDDDDEWIDPKKLEKQIEYLVKNPEYVLVGTGVIVVDEKGDELTRYLMPEKDAEIRQKILRVNPFVHTSVMFRKDQAVAFGGYRPEKLSEDHDLWLRLGRENKFANIPEFCLKYQMSLSGLNSQNKLTRLWQNMSFAKENKDFYPNYFMALVTGILKILFFPLFLVVPRNLKGFFLKLHKKI